MSKDIKTKTTIKDIKVINKAVVVGEHIRTKSAKTKESVEENSDPQTNSQKEYAASQISSNTERFAKHSVLESKIQTQKKAHFTKNKIKTKKEQWNETIDDTPNSSKQSINKNTITSSPSSENIKDVNTPSSTSKIRTKEPTQKNIKSTDSKSRKNRKFKKSMIKQPRKGGKTMKEKTKTTIKTTQEIAKQSIIHSAKSYKGSYYTVKTIGRNSFAVVKNTASSVKHIIEATRTAITLLCSIGWIAILIILLIALIGGIFMTGSSESGEGNQLSPDVISHTETLQKYANKYEIPHFLGVLQAIMMQESSGKGSDPMQSSECAFNKKFPNVPNAITDSDYSIQVGVQNFAESLKQAECNDPLDIPKLSLALQSYNYGNGYVNWALKNFGAYSLGNAKVFSDEQAQKHGWSSYGDPEYVPHVLRYYQFAGLGSSGSKLVNIAVSQVGNQLGTPYWSWYGYEKRVEWCACFISWVAYQSGDLNVTIPKFAAVVDGVKWYKNKGQWKDRNFIPKSGDIIFFDWENDGIPDHVGIVEKVEDGIVYTIEGNSDDQCRQNTYTLASNLIFGFGIVLG